ncbi:MAG: hypothetical protein GY816_07290 [Cytophagales bacterium]|nr:hypothetical protein [Cytophagales bacterium]
MKSIYLNAALEEKLLDKKNVGYIQRMQQYADKNEPFTLDVFRSSGRLIQPKAFCERYDVPLNQDTKHVMVYLCGSHIELLKNGNWYLDIGTRIMKESEDISELELELYDWLNDEIKDGRTQW